jgi:hypothetical protein
MSVSVIGQDYDNVDGLQVSLAAHRKAHRENGDIILNLEDAARARAKGLKGPAKTDPRPPHVHRPFPKHTYHADGRDRVVADSEELAKAKEEGFREQPYPVVRVAVGDPAAEKAALQKKLQESDGKVTVLNEALLQMQERLAALEAGGGRKPAKGKKSDPSDDEI